MTDARAASAEWACFARTWRFFLDASTRDDTGGLSQRSSTANNRHALESIPRTRRGTAKT
jgi:hypothetical protein